MQLGSKRKCVAQDLTDTGHQTGEYIKHRGTIIRANVFSFGSKRVQSKIEVQSKSKDRPPLPAVCMYFVCNWIQRPSASLKISRARGIVQVHTSSIDRDHHKSHITRAGMVQGRIQTSTSHKSKYRRVNIKNRQTKINVYATGSKGRVRHSRFHGQGA